MIELEVNAEYYDDIRDIVAEQFEADCKILIICKDEGEALVNYHSMIQQLEEIPGVKGVPSYKMAYTPFGTIRFETPDNAEKLLIGMHGAKIYFTTDGLFNSKITLLSRINHATR